MRWPRLRRARVGTRDLVDLESRVDDWGGEVLAMVAPIMRPVARVTGDTVMPWELALVQGGASVSLPVPSVRLGGVQVVVVRSSTSGTVTVVAPDATYSVTTGARWFVCTGSTWR